MTFSPFNPLGVIRGRNRQPPSQNNSCPFGTPDCPGPGGAVRVPVCSSCLRTFFARPNSEPPAWRSKLYAEIPNAGIRAGEVKAWRFWRVTPIHAEQAFPGEPSFGEDIRFWLQSISRGSRWYPGERMQGDVTIAGVFSWNNEMMCYREALEWLQDGEEPFYVMGTIKLWGEVIEHEYGYRSEFGEIASLDSVVTTEFYLRGHTQMWVLRHRFNLNKLRREYGLC